MQANEKYLLCRPDAGLNDTLVQIEICRRYARMFNRRLIVDPSVSCFGKDLFRYFVPTAGFGEYLELGKDISVEALEGLSTYPPEIAGRISSYRAKWVAFGNGRVGGFCESETGVELKFDLSHNFKEDLVVRHAAGGGRASLHTLRHMKISSDAMKKVELALSGLPKNYIALHLRATDATTNFKELGAKLIEHTFGKEVLICSDNLQVRNEFAGKLSKNNNVFFVSDLPDLGGSALHYNKEYRETNNYNLNIVTDLVAMAISDELIFGHFKGGMISGFSVLAEGLRVNLDLQRDLMIHASKQFKEKHLSDSRIGVDSELSDIIDAEFSPVKHARKKIATESHKDYWIENPVTPSRTSSSRARKYIYILLSRLRRSAEHIMRYL